MPETPREITLARDLARTLSMPIFIVDKEGSLLFYNKPAEKVLGRRFEQTGQMSAGVWSRVFVPTDEHGTPLFPESLPLMIALTENRPAHARLWISGIDNVRRLIEVAAIPLATSNNESVGAMAIFWEVNPGSQ